jgi:hypothetical protein
MSQYERVKMMKSTFVPKPYVGGDKVFKDACILAGVQPTKRQYSRWKQGRGQAFARKGEAVAAQETTHNMEAA